jgi:type II secretory pathway pseudopilin PulG
VRSLIDFSTWQGILTTLLGIAVFSLVAVGIRLLLMQTVQQRRERENRQINERLKTLIAAYKTLGGSFTGNLMVDPRHLRETRATQAIDEDEPAEGAGSDRRRRVRDAVEAALSDVILLGTEDQVRLAARAAEDMVAGRTVETAALVISLRNFIRSVLDLDAVPAALTVPNQGPLRPAGAAGRGARGEGAGSGRGGRAGGSQAGGGTGGVGLAAASGSRPDDETNLG